MGGSVGHAIGAGVLSALVLVGCGPSIPQPKATDAQVDRIERHAHGLRGYPEAELSALAGGVLDGRRLIMVHGTPGDAGNWADYLLEPPPGMRVLAPDRPGFGESGPAGAVVSLRDQALALEPLLPPPGAPPAILLGHSLGGPIIAKVALEFPERVAALVIVAGALDPDLEDPHWVQPIADSWPLVALLPRHIRNANKELLALEPELRTLSDRLPEIEVPVVILHGTEDQLVPYANVPFMRARFQGAPVVEVVTLDGANHFLPWNAEEAIRRVIERAVSLAG